MKTSLLLTALALLLLTPGTAMAGDICEDINDLANGWNDVANAADAAAESGFSDAEANELLDLAKALAEDTEGLIGFLESGDATQQALAEGIVANLQVLVDADEADGAVVSAVDGVVDAIDAVTDDCDSD